MVYFAPRSVEDALGFLRDETALVMAGGTDIYPATDGALPEAVLDITGIAALRSVTETGDEIRIGAATRWCELAGAVLRPGCEALRQAARCVGGSQIQNSGTIGGNICNASPAADSIPPLLVLDAEIELTSAQGLRRMPLGDFLTGPRQTLRRPDELLTAICLPTPAHGAKSAFRKLGSRKYLVISIAMVAAFVRRTEQGGIGEARIAVGACSPVACRLPELEADLVGQNPLGPDIENRHLTALSPIDDMRGTAEYRGTAVGELIRRAIREAVHG